MVILIKIVKFIIKKILIAGFLLFGYNMIAQQFNMVIPINLYTIGIVTVLGSCGLTCLSLFKYFIL